MNKNSYTFFIAIVCFLLSYPLSSQTPTASFATWKDNKKAAYTIIHDDYSNYVTGIYQYAYPIAKARGVKICFGAITGSCGATEWANARTMIANGHECVNHSHNHKCGGSASQCTGLTTYGTADFNTELNQSTTLIETNTGVRPLFFIHPYDASSTAILNHLQGTLGYLGSRAGTQGIVNPSNFTNYMQENYFVYDGTAAALTSLKTAVDAAISSGGYAVREFHGIDDGSWAAMTQANYTSHLDYVKTKVDDGSLWSATASEAITYKMQRDAYQPLISYTSSTGIITVSFTTLQTLNTAILKTPVTVNVNLNGITGTYNVTQGATNVAATRNGNIISFNVYPHQGTVTLRCSDCSVTPPATPANILNLAATPQTNAMTLAWSNPTSNFDEVMIVAKPTSAFTTTPSGTTYTADANYTGTGTAFEGGKVIYKGIGTNVNVTNLVGGTRYYFKAFSRLGTAWSTGVEINAVPNSTTVVTPVPGCLQASYFSNATLTGTPFKIQGESKIDYNWGSAAPLTGMPVDNFSVRWEGVVNPPLTGNYVFSVTADDGVRLWVNNTLVVDKWVDQSPTTYTATVSLTQGQAIPIKMEYYERTGGTTAKLAWTVPTLASQVIAFNSTCPITQPPTAGFDATKCYRIDARHSNRPVQLVTRSTSNGIKLEQGTWSNSRSEIWRIKNIDNTYYHITSGYSGKYMTVTGNSTLSGATLEQNVLSNTTENQRFKFDKNTEGYYVITVKHSNQVLTIRNGATASGASVIQSPLTNVTYQQFKVAETACPANTSALENSRIVAFNGKYDNGTAVLDWAVKSEDLMDYYEVEKANEAGEFKSLKIVNGTSAEELRYFTYTDTELSEGDNHYRLVSVGSDGTSITSEVVTVKYTQPDAYSVYPNPASEYFTLDLSPLKGQEVDIAVISPVGTIIKTEHIETPSVATRFDLNGIENGQYFVRIQAKGKKTIMKKLMIIK